MKFWLALGGLVVILPGLALIAYGFLGLGTCTILAGALVVHELKFR